MTVTLYISIKNFGESFTEKMKLIRLEGDKIFGTR